MNMLTAALNRRSIAVFRFEFPYMAERRASGKKRPPDRMPVLLDCWQEAFFTAAKIWHGDRLFIGGKSMGDRAASMLAERLPAAGVCCYGYPFYPPGRPEKLRTAHLETVQTPVLIVQGARDPFGRSDTLVVESLSKQVSICWLDDGDHDFKPRQRSGLNQMILIDEAALLTQQFIERV